MNAVAAPKAHSRLGASNCKRWWACPGSVRACKDIENKGTPYANEGSAAHALAEYCLRNKCDAEPQVGHWVGMDGRLYFSDENIAEKDKGDTIFEITEEMAEAVQVYLDFFNETVEEGDEYDIEQRINLSTYHPDLFGTADLVVYKPGSKTLVVADYKHGRGVPVEVTENVQGLYYAAGSAHRLHNRGIAKVEVVIVQPRCPHKDGPVRRWSTTPLDLMEWVVDLVEAARRTEDPNAPRSAGDHCKFCPAAGSCAEYQGAALKAAAADFATDGSVILTPPTSYSPEKLAQTIQNIDIIQSWCQAVKKFAHDEALAGRVVPGFKLVATRANRKFKDPDAARARFEIDELDPSEFMTEPKLLSVAQVEKAIGKKAFAAYEKELVEKKSSGVVLAPLDDKREAVKPDAAAEFA